MHAFFMPKCHFSSDTVLHDGIEHKTSSYDYVLIVSYLAQSRILTKGNHLRIWANFFRDTANTAAKKLWITLQTRHMKKIGLIARPILTFYSIAVAYNG
jgi:hypothetical protein